MNVRYIVKLNDDERAELKGLLAKGKRSARKMKRAQILLAADAGESDETIATSVGAGTSTVFRTKRRFVEGNLERALTEDKRPGAKRKLSGKEEALLVATTCSAPPVGRARWTLSLLAGVMVALTDHKELSTETVRRRLGESKLKPWRQEMWCVPEINGEYVARMEHVLDLYAEPPDPRWPLVCFDESPTQLIGEVREPIPARPGQLQRYDSEYQRNGTVNLFIFIDAHRRWRHVKITDRRTALDFAECMRELVDVHYPTAELIRVVLDNLSTHTPGALYEAFDPEEARRILRRIEFHFVPKHGSWLNMAEIEIGVLRGQCLERRIEDVAVLRAEVAAWEMQRNDAKATIKWTFTTEIAREKMGRAYPKASAPRLDAPVGIAAEASMVSNPASPAIEPTAATLGLESLTPNPAAADLIAASPALEQIDRHPAEEPVTANPAVEPIGSCPPAESNQTTSANQASETPAANKIAKRQRRRVSRGPLSRFKARPTIPAKRPCRKKSTKRPGGKTARVEPVKTSVRSY
jgi:transposase